MNIRRIKEQNNKICNCCGDKSLNNKISYRIKTDDNIDLFYNLCEKCFNKEDIILDLNENDIKIRRLRNQNKIECNNCSTNSKTNEVLIVKTNLFSSVIDICEECLEKEDLNVVITHNNFVSPKIFEN